MVTIVTDMVTIGLKNRNFLKKKREKSSKMLKTELKNGPIPLFLPPNRAFWGRNAAGKCQNSTKNREKRQKLVEVEKCMFYFCSNSPHSNVLLSGGCHLNSIV
jgi:hypothetical protein